MKILVVDDSSFFRKQICRELANVGYESNNVESGVEAVSLLATDYNYDLIILDIEMPKMNGFETYKEILQAKNKKIRDIPVVFVTAHDSIEYRKRGFELGANDFMRKEASFEELILVIDRILKPKKQFEGCRAIVVDDSPMTLKLLSQVLTSQGIEVILASDGTQAYDLVKENIGRIDLLITDAFLKELSGLELLQKISRDFGARDFPKIVITAFPDKNNIVDFFNAGATDYLTKPYLKEELLARLYSQLESFALKKYLKGNINSLVDIIKLKDSFLSICSHDLRSPLTSILGHSALLMKEKNIPEKFRKPISIIERTGKHLLEIVKNLLDLRAIELKEDYSMTPNDLNEILSTAIATMSGAAQAKDIILDLKLEEDIVTEVVADKLALTRVFNNLLSNSIKFSPVGAMISISVDSSNEEKVKINVQDCGVGIPNDKIDSIFEAFTPSHKKGTRGEKGTGLGLSIVKAIIEKHNGAIKVESAEGSGSCFVVELPFNVAG